jgi:type IV secretory pathway VirB2 component (pilin)
MGISVLGAIAAALTAIAGKASHPIAGPVVITIGVVFGIMILVGFFFASGSSSSPVEERSDEVN